MNNEMVPGNAMMVPRSVVVGTEEIVLTKSELTAGMQSGLVAAYAMGLTAMVVTWVHSWGLWTPFNDVTGAIIQPLAGADARFSMVSILFSVALHFIISCVLGIIFAVLYSRVIKPEANSGMPIVFGFVFGLLTWLVARYTVFPLLGSEIYGTAPFLVVHLVFGATLGLLYPAMLAFRRRF